MELQPRRTAKAVLCPSNHRLQGQNSVENNNVLKFLPQGEFSFRFPVVNPILETTFFSTSPDYLCLRVRNSEITVIGIYLPVLKHLLRANIAPQ